MTVFIMQVGSLICKQYSLRSRRAGSQATNVLLSEEFQASVSSGRQLLSYFTQ